MNGLSSQEAKMEGMTAAPSLHYPEEMRRIGRDPGMARDPKAHDILPGSRSWDMMGQIPQGRAVPP